jgi:hypothetical protein
MEGRVTNRDLYGTCVGPRRHHGVSVCQGRSNNSCRSALRWDPPDKSSAGAPNSTTPAAIVPSSSSPSPVGKWAGQVQYQAIENGQVVQEAHSVVLLSAEFTLDGKIVATSADNGCQLLGIWSEDAQHMVWLDVTLNTCRYGSLNRRFGGSFLMAKPDSSGQLQIIATELPHVGQGARENDVKGTLRR